MSDSHELQELVLQLGQKARQAALQLANFSTEQKNQILEDIADELLCRCDLILQANRIDLEQAEQKQVSLPLLNRLALDQEKIAQMANAVRKLVELPDPVGEVLDSWTLENGVEVTKRRVPIGTIGIVYESRPNVTCDAAALCFKSGNATILRGGSEAFHSNQAIAEAIVEGGRLGGIPDGAVQLMPVTDRQTVRYLAEMDQYLDLIIPRGGRGLIEAVVSAARMPVIKHYDGVCHVYVDQFADHSMATGIVVNAKCQKPSVCNALETLLIHEAVAEEFLACMVPELTDAGVTIRGDDQVCRLVPDAVLANDSDWTTEYLNLILAIRIVPNAEAAIEHINRYGSHHSDCIVTDREDVAEVFLNTVDSATVYWNASTRFTDGEEFGFGAEIGISTDKLHARGPMALPELTSYKYLLKGHGQIRY